MRTELLLFALVLAAFVTLQVWRLRSATRTSRSAMFDDCSELLGEATLTQRGANFPELSGTYARHAIQLRLGFEPARPRALCLYLSCECVRAHRIATTIVLRTLRGTPEPAAQSMTIATPAEWPQGVKMLGASAQALPSALVECVRALHAGGDCLRLVLHGGVIECVLLLAQADPADYFVLRDMVYDGVRVSRARLTHTLDALVALAAAPGGDA